MSTDQVTKKENVAESKKNDGARTGSAQNGDKKKTFKRKNFRRPKRLGNKTRTKPEFSQKIVDLRRVTRVVAGGRRFSFRVSIILGDKNGRVGFGTGKSTDTTLAIQKAVANAKKNMVKLKLTEDNSIPYDVSAKYASAVVNIRPNYGRGIVAGSAVRHILELAGVKDVTSKIMSRTKNKINIARATLKALRDFVEATGEEVLKKKEANEGASQRKERVSSKS